MKLIIDETEIGSLENLYFLLDEKDLECKIEIELGKYILTFDPENEEKIENLLREYFL